MIDANPLPKRLAALRRRLRLVTAVRGACWPTALVLAAALAVGTLDWRLHLRGGEIPTLARATILTSVLAAAGCLGRLLLHKPRTDDLALALRVETTYPLLGDRLASAVQFLAPRSVDLSDPALRRAAVERAQRAVGPCDFRNAVKARGAAIAGACAAMAGLVAGTLAMSQPALAQAALARLADPYGSHSWPKQTRLTLTTGLSPVARGTPYEIQAFVSGVVPEEATLECEGAVPVQPAWPIRYGRLQARLERVEQSFRFRVWANDAVTAWRAVEVLPPPTLALHAGHPSPQVRLRPPAYTGRPAADLPDGSGDIDAVAGTAVQVEATADRPLARAWIEVRPANGAIGTGAFLGSLGSAGPAEALAAIAVGHEVWGSVPARLELDGRSLRAEFMPRTSGTYVMHLEDRRGLTSTRFWELRLRPDPASEAQLTLSGSVNGSDVLPDAVLPLQVSAADREYGLRSVSLEYRCGRDGPPTSLPISGRVAGDEGRASTTPSVTLSWPGPRRFERRGSLAIRRLRRADGSPVCRGDVVYLWAQADDFDDITPHKSAGRSREVQLRVVGQPELDAALDRIESRLGQELLRLSQLQQQALADVGAVERRWQQPTPSADVLDALGRVEQRQRQVREGAAALPSELTQTLTAARDNNRTAFGSARCLELIAAELERLNRQVLPAIESQLTHARKGGELAGELGRASAPALDDLVRAHRSQEQAADTLERLARVLDPGTVLTEARERVEDLTRRQQQLGDRARRPSGETADQQARMAERADELLDTLELIGVGRREIWPETAAALEEAAEGGRAGGLSDHMKGAAADLRAGRPVDAARKQQDALRTLGQMARGLGDRQRAEQIHQDRAWQAAAGKLAALAHSQDELEAAARAATGPRREQLGDLARRQQDLRHEADGLRRDLQRLPASRAAQAVADAAESMDKAARHLGDVANAGPAQAEARDRLQDARERLSRGRRVAPSLPIPLPLTAVSGASKEQRAAFSGTAAPAPGGARPPATGSAVLPKEVWGHLPESARLEADQYARDQYMTRYSDLLRQYYTTVAEKGKRMEEGARGRE